MAMLGGPRGLFYPVAAVSLVMGTYWERDPLMASMAVLFGIAMFEWAHRLSHRARLRLHVLGIISFIQFSLIYGAMMLVALGPPLKWSLNDVFMAVVLSMYIGALMGGITTAFVLKRRTVPTDKDGATA